MVRNRTKETEGQSDRCVSALGTDRMTWAALRRSAPELLPRLAGQLTEGTWQPGVLRPIQISTYTGKQLPAVIQSVLDRLVRR